MTRTGRCALLIAGLTAAWAVHAAYQAADLGLSNTTPVCSSNPGRFNYDINWNDVPQSTRYQVNSGNQCSLAGSVCGISNKDCVVSCSEGACGAQVTGCLSGRGASWIQVTALNAPRFQRKAVTPPGSCQ